MTHLDDAIGEYVRSKSVGTDDAPGNYASGAERVLGEFQRWARGERSVVDVDEVDYPLVRAYGRHLGEESRQGEYAASTANTYFAIVRAFLAWCVRERLLDRNPAAAENADEGLPQETTTDTQQFWTADARRKLLDHVRARADNALDTPQPPWTVRVRRLRDWAMVELLANAGVRGAEVFRAPKDSRREGLRWAHLHFDDEYVEVFGKSQRWEEAPFPASAQRACRALRLTVDPPADWPVFPTRHRPTLYGRVREALGSKGFTEAEVEELLDDAPPAKVAADHGIQVPAVTTNGARSRMESLCETAGASVDGEYLKPHGGRRKLGDELYRQNPAMSQSALRHASIEVTHESYSHIQAGEVGAEIEALRADDD
jgi:integrase